MKRLTKYDPDWPGWPLLERPRGALCTSKFYALSDRCDHIGDRTCPYIQMVDRLAAIEDILGEEYELDRLRELVEADRDERCVVVPVAIGATVYHITTCKDFPKVLDGTLYDDNGALGTATGYYCPCELAKNCPFDAEDDAEDFDCDENKNKLNVFEDTVEGIHIDEYEEYFRLNYSGAISFEDIGKTVFLTRAEAEAALMGYEVVEDDPTNFCRRKRGRKNHPGLSK